MPTTFDLDAIRAHLPADGAGLVVGPEPQAAALALALGDRFRVLEASRTRQAPAPIHAVAVALLSTRSAPAISALVAAVAPHLAKNARLLLLPRDVSPSAEEGGLSRERELTVALSGAGFVILREVSGLVVARKEPFAVRAYRDGDEAQILPLFARSFHVERSAEKFRWIYQQNPYGNRKISLALGENGALIAQYAGYPVRIYRQLDDDRSDSLTALHIGDTMTEPAVRHIGRGATSLLGRTVRHFYAAYCEGQVGFNYGVNTGNIQRFSMRFVGVRRLEEVPYHVRDARAPVTRAWRSRLRGYRVERLRSVDTRFDELFEGVRRHYDLLVARDAPYLDWRYLRNPDSEYALWAAFRRDRLIGWSVFRRRNETLAWGDALFDPAEPEAVDALFARVLAADEQRGIERVETWLPARPAAWKERVLALGFVGRPEPQGLDVGIVPFLLLDAEELLRQRWYYTMGDFDLF